MRRQKRSRGRALKSLKASDWLNVVSIATRLIDLVWAIAKHFQ